MRGAGEVTPPSRLHAFDQEHFDERLRHVVGVATAIARNLNEQDKRSALRIGRANLADCLTAARREFDFEHTGKTSQRAAASEDDICALAPADRHEVISECCD